MKSRLALTCLIPLLIWTQAGPVHASCLPAPPLWQSLAAAPVVFAGTVTALEGGDRIATVAVDEVWKGEVPRAVQVRGGPADPQLITSVDRTFEVDTKYLFVPATDSTPFEDNFCTATQEYTPEIKMSRPLDVSAPGWSGTAGRDGADGADGIGGADGADGADGLGTDGEPGRPGRSGTGTNGRDGADGADGRPGSDGQPGQPGQAGGAVSGTESTGSEDGPSQATKAAIFALALGLALAAGWALKTRPKKRD